jgi:hypothetical protein
LLLSNGTERALITQRGDGATKHNGANGWEHHSSCMSLKIVAIAGPFHRAEIIASWLDFFEQ